MSLLVREIKEIPNSGNQREYEQVKEAVEELKSKVNDFNLLSVQLDSLWDDVNNLTNTVGAVNRDLVKHIDEFINIYRDIDNTL